jgi:hypothetical protein
MKLFFLVSVLLLSTHASARPDIGKLKPLQFQADKNNLQVLPQRFEYALLEDGSIRIGDILIDQTKLNFQISKNEKEQYQLTFHWPAGLLREGDLIIKNNIGKAILKQKITKDFSQNDRSESAEYTLSISNDQVDDMKFSPFMSFCVFREDAGTRIYLCSQEVFLSHRKGPLTIKSREENSKAAQVEINGQVVGNQGYIFLNSAREKIYLKAFAKSGSFLEIETRRKDVGLKDVVASEDGKHLILTASGAEPVDTSNVKKISDTDWQATLDMSRPYIYVKGDGDIPMRQELLVKGPLPTEQDRAYIETNARTRSYAANTSLRIYAPAKSSVKALDKASTVDSTNPDYSIWNIENIPAKNQVRRYLQIKTDNKKQTVVSQEFIRGTPYELGANISFLSPSSIAYFSAYFTGWLNAGDLHWGLNLDHQTHLTTKTGEAKMDITSAQVLYRFNSGFYMEDETWGASLYYQSLKTDTITLSTPGLGLFAHKKASSKWVNWLSWYHLNLKYFLGSSGSTVKLKQAYALDANAYRPLNRSLSLNYGLGLLQYKFDPAAAKESMQIVLRGGISYGF